MQAGMTSSGGTDTGRTTEPSQVKQLHEVVIVITASQRRISTKSEATDVAVRDREGRKGTERTTEPGPNAVGSGQFRRLPVSVGMAHADDQCGASYMPRGAWPYR
jgi:hypothetical protein